MSTLLIVAAIIAALVGFICWTDDAGERDWRDEWCVPECRAAHDQGEPCGDCPARRAAHK